MSQAKEFKTSIIKDFRSTIFRFFPFAYGIGLLLVLATEHITLSNIIFEPLLILTLLCFLYFAAKRRGGIFRVQISENGFVIHHGNPKSFSIFVPWASVKMIKVHRTFPKYAGVTKIHLLCAKEGIISTCTSFTIHFPSGLVDIELPSPLCEPEEFKHTVLQTVPANNPLVIFMRETPTYSGW